MDEVKLLPCDRCGGKRHVLDVKPGVDPLKVYPEEMPCPKCTDGTWVDAVARPPIVTDEVVGRVKLALLAVPIMCGTYGLDTDDAEALARAAIASMPTIDQDGGEG